MALFSKLSNNVKVSEALEKRPNVITEDEIIDIIFDKNILEDLDMAEYLEEEKEKQRFNEDLSDLFKGPSEEDIAAYNDLLKELKASSDRDDIIEYLKALGVYIDNDFFLYDESQLWSVLKHNLGDGGRISITRGLADAIAKITTEGQSPDALLAAKKKLFKNKIIGVKNFRDMKVKQDQFMRDHQNRFNSMHNSSSSFGSRSSFNHSSSFGSGSFGNSSFGSRSFTSNW